MGYVFATGLCFGCKQPFTFNPMRVPSLPAHLSSSGTREPICLNCVNRANRTREANGLALIVPLPDAYEPCDEGELS